jgi:hypothetical protein
MKILKYFILFLVLYFFANTAFWGYQEYINYEDVQTIRTLDTKINIDNTIIEEKAQNIQRESQQINNDKLYLEQLLVDQKYAQYNEAIIGQNAKIDAYNQSIKEYESLVDEYNANIRKINELLLKSSTRKYLFPLPTYVPELYKEI